MVMQGPKPQDQLPGQTQAQGGPGAAGEGYQPSNHSSNLSDLSPLSSLSSLASLSDFAGSETSETTDTLRIIKANKPNVVAFLKDPNPKKQCGYRWIRHVTTNDYQGPNNRCVPCELLTLAGKDPRDRRIVDGPPYGRSDPTMKIVRSVDVVEMALNSRSMPWDSIPRSYWYVVRRKYVVKREGNEHLEELPDAYLDPE